MKNIYLTPKVKSETSRSYASNEQWQNKGGMSSWCNG